MQSRGRIDTRSPVNWQHPLNRGLLAWWLPLPGRAGGGTLFDLAGRYPLTVGGPTWAVGPAGFAGLRYASDTDRASLGTFPAAPAAGTVALWVTPYWSGGDGATHMFWAFATAPATDTPSFQKYLDNTIYCGFQGAGGGEQRITLAASSLFNAGEPAHWVFTYSSSGCVLYRNGVSVGSRGATTIVTGTGLVLGNYQAGVNKNANAVLSDFRLNDWAMSAADVAGLYDQARRGHPGTLRRYTPRAWLAPPGRPPPPPPAGSSFPAAVVGGGYGW